jgi:MFS family permease
MQKNQIKKYYYGFSFFRDLFFVSGVLIPFFTQWGGISMFQVQFLQSWFMFWNFILEVPTGVVADYFGRKKSVMLGLIFFGIGILIYGFIPSFYMFLVCEFILALGVALMSGADKALFFDSLKDIGEEKECKKLFGKAHSWKLIALLISGPIGSFIGSKMGLNMPMIFSSISIFIAFLFISRFKEPKQYEMENEGKKYFYIFTQGIKFVKNNDFIRKLSLNGILINSAGYFIIWLYQPMLSKLDIPIIYFGYFHAFLVLVQVIVSSNFGFFEKKFGFNNYLKFSSMMVLIFFLLVVLIPNIFTVILLIVFAGGFGLTHLEFVYAHLNENIPSNMRATILSTVGLFSSLFLFMLNPIIGFLADRSLIIAFGIISLLPMIALTIKTKKRI